MSNIIPIKSAKKPDVYVIEVTSHYNGITEAVFRGCGQTYQDGINIISDLKVIIKAIEEQIGINKDSN